MRRPSRGHAWPARAARIVLALIATLTVVARTADAHPIHTTLTVLTPGDGRHTMVLNIRAFADDFSATVATFAGRRARADSSVATDEVTRYVREHFTVVDASGASLQLIPCGVRRANELYWLCFKVSLPGGLAGISLRNLMLTELHADQVNIVQVEDGAERKSFLFTRGSEGKVVGGR